MQCLYNRNKNKFSPFLMKSISKDLGIYLFKVLFSRSNTIILSSCLISVFSPILVSAQIVTDGTVNTLVDYNGKTYTIKGGSTSGNNLFQSFSEFSLPTGKEAFFDNSTSVNNIISRVTGVSKSNIDGLIRANCCANLFFINPNGIIFGPNASLDIGGSFFGSTASEITFPDGKIFSATDPTSSSLLSINIPSGLHFRDNSGGIFVNGTGHNVSAPTEESPIFDVPVNSGLKVKNGQTLALLGGAINLDGGILSAPSGRIELGSVNSGTVALNQTSQSWNLDYRNVNSFQDIMLFKQSLVNASGSREGFIRIQGANITLKDGSLLYIQQNEGNQSGTSIDLKSTESINLIGSAPSQTGLVPSAVLIENISDGNSSDISITTQRLLLKQGGNISTSNFGAGQGSNISVYASDSTQLIESLGTENQTLISTSTDGTGDAGDLLISTKRLNLINGGAIGSITFGTGNSGNVTVRSSEFVELSGDVIPTPLLTTTIASTTFGPGNSGNVIIDTQKLKILNGATIVTSTFSGGNAGTLTINASDSVLLSGVSTYQPTFRSGLASAARFIPQFGFTEPPTGSTGNLIINTPKLSITDGAGINISHDGTGNAGNLTINARSVFLNEGRITAETKSGLGGNININVKDDILLLRNNSFISANAKGKGDGGNIKIKAPFLVSFPNENSDIIANSLFGSGGRVEITANAVFGFDIRSREELQQLLGTTDPNKLDPRLLPSNDITAISQSSPSLNGQVTLNLQDVDPSKNLAELPETVIDPDTQVAQNPCNRGWGNELTVSGRGGLPPSPSQDLSSEATQIKLVEPVQASNGTQNNLETQEKTSSLNSVPEAIVAPAQGWVYNKKGQVVLVAYDPTITGAQRLKVSPAGCPVP
jgi:filamentous hemagglutinin family protein